MSDKLDKILDAYTEEELLEELRKRGSSEKQEALDSITQVDIGVIRTIERNKVLSNTFDTDGYCFACNQVIVKLEQFNETGGE